MLLLDRPLRNEVRLPKGHIEPGEAAEQAALRETTEESGYRDLEIIDDLGSQIVEFVYNEDHVMREERYFLMQLHGNRRVRRSKKDQAQFQILWLPLDQVIDRLTYAAEQEWARRAITAYQATSLPQR